MEQKKWFILLVDGNAKDLFFTGMLLQRLEYDVYISSSAEDGLKIIAAGLPAMIVMELALPKMSGQEFIRFLKSEGRTANIPVVVLAASLDAAAEERCRSLGCTDVLRKPVEPNTLYRTIQAALEPTPRQYVRLKTFLWAKIDEQTPSDGPVAAEFVTALSENGMYVQTLNPRPVKSVHPISIVIDDRQVTARAVVLYSYSVGGGPFKEPGMGMKFVEIAENNRDIIRNYIKDQLTKNITPE